MSWTFYDKTPTEAIPGIAMMQMSYAQLLWHIVIILPFWVTEREQEFKIVKASNGKTYTMARLLYIIMKVDASIKICL